MPYPPYRGDKLKIYNLATELSANHELHLITIAESQEDVDSVSALQKPFFLDDAAAQTFNPGTMIDQQLLIQTREFNCLIPFNTSIDPNGVQYCLLR